MRLLKGKSEVVAPISAPMLQIVAIPVHESDSTPGPWYSMMAPVPPLTVRIPATLRMTSAHISSGCSIALQLTFGGGPSAHLAVEVDSNDLGRLELPWDVGHHVDGIGTTDTTCDHTETSGVGGVRISSDHHETGDGIVLEDNLVTTTG